MIQRRPQELKPKEIREKFANKEVDVTPGEAMSLSHRLKKWLLERNQKKEVVKNTIITNNEQNKAIVETLPEAPKVEEQKKPAIVKHSHSYGR